MPGRTIFWDVDTQRDFMEPDGALYVPGAEAIVDNLAGLQRYARVSGIPIVHTADDHELTDDEIAVDGADFHDTFPPHCLRGTPGAERIAETAPEEGAYEIAWNGEGIDPSRVAWEHEIVLHKKRFDVFSNPATPAVLDALAPPRVVVYGVALDVCDRFAVEGMLERGGAEIVVVADATAAIDVAEGNRLLADWASRGVRIVSTGEVLGGTVG
jgi:nicotinamidase/pyrazinamidase